MGTSWLGCLAAANARRQRACFRAAVVLWILTAAVVAAWVLA
jgi:hypothetical protein